MPKGIEKPKDPQKKKRQRTIKQRRLDRRAARRTGSSWASVARPRCASVVACSCRGRPGANRR